MNKTIFKKTKKISPPPLLNRGGRNFLTLLLVASISPFSLANTQQALGLVEVYQMAVLQDAPLAQARAQHQSEQQNYATARAELLPNIQADASYFVTDSNNDISDSTRQDMSITLNQSIYKHEVWAGFEQVKHSLKTSDFQLKTAEQDLILRVAESYFNALLAQKNLQLFQSKERADLSQLERAQASAEVGLASRVDVLQAKSSYDLSRSERINAENSLDIQFEELMKLTGKPITQLKSFSMQVNLPEVPLDLYVLEQRAESQSLTVKQTKSQLDTAELEVDLQKGGHWPAINFQAKLSDTSYIDTTDGFFFRDSQQTSVGISVTLPLYSGGGTSSKVSAARYQLNATQEQLRNSREEARLQARIQVRNLESGRSLISALQEAVKSNDAFLEAAEEGYHVGLMSLLDVLSARANQTAARKNLIEAMHNQVLNRLRLESILGDLTMDDLVAFDRLLQESEVIVANKAISP
ncbi:Type I secretion outer membrane protein, TolC family [hydrothermal vent metagenome]|uniref:Type I secretion outer membrane protein, TolC family n=1 Tax=hydrothermal vent metagenome TaxID=652676 RepID=A0A3B0WH22_9ZZZZ